MENMCRQMYEDFSKLLSENETQQRFYNWVLANGRSFKGRTLAHQNQWVRAGRCYGSDIRGAGR